ncbi:NAD(P)-dependent oxidoreductase [bacterium]|nr:NAD(P)-dependent oxidoreductase [bacterium]MBU1994480.1 NAD(P)-dependent oxidoreductase [bacterium]
MGKIVLLGSSGFIGKNIFEYFQNRGEEIVGFGSKECDLLDADSLGRALEILKPEDTLLLASSITRLRENSLESMNKNILMIQNLLRKLQECKVKHLLFFSSIDVYGVKNLPHAIDESTPLNPEDYYAVSKVAGEYILKVFCAQNGIKLTRLRASGVYGKYDYTNSTIAKIVTNIYKNKSAALVGDGSLQRDFLPVGILVQVLDFAIKNELEGVLNVATGTSISLMNLIKKVFSLLEIPFDIRYEKAQELRAGDLFFDTRALQEKIPLFAPKPIDTYLKEYITLFRKHNEK